MISARKAEIIICHGVAFRRSRTNACNAKLDLELRPWQAILECAPTRGYHVPRDSWQQCETSSVAPLATYRIVEKIGEGGMGDGLSGRTTKSA